MYQIKAMGILGDLLVQVTYLEPTDGHWQAVAETQRVFVLEEGSDLDADLRAIAKALLRIAQGDYDSATV